ncbi:MAG: Ig-like domain-containing protein [Chloroflexi bacterium]|nr:Ig-like domain-containing protein [Chloroflexota bacterium]
MKKILIPIILFLLCGLLTTAGVAIYAVMTRETARPIVLITEPSANAQINVGESITIQSLARDALKIKRIELWVDGQLIDAQASNLPGGISPFPLTTRWQPRTPGAHTIVARAYNTSNGRAHASINLNAMQAIAMDRSPTGTVDANDACSQTQSSTASYGCPVPGDRDGDRVADASDACPDQSGTAPLAGCPDGDADGVRDRDDACPDVPGIPGASGCPDRDGDGVRDAFDLCLDTPGPRENAGCPVTGAGDRDHDGVHDDADLAPDEPGTSESGGAPLPGGGGDDDGDHIADDEEDPSNPLDNFGAVPGEHLVGVTFDALEFKLNEDYDEVYCYASLGGAVSVVERIGPFDAMGSRRWDIAEYLGGDNSRFVALPVNTPLQGHVECSAYNIRVIPGEGEEGTYWDLGAINVSHLASDWDGHVVTQRSIGGASSRSFEVKYRMCAGTCRSSDFPPPMLHLFNIGGRRQLVWLWSGDRSNIDGFRVYINGNRIYSLHANLSSHFLASAWEPQCGQRRTFQLSAYRGTRESPLSNLTYWTGQACPRTARVTFESFTTSNFGDDERRGDGIIGPIRGGFFAAASERQNLTFKADYCHWLPTPIPLSNCDGLSLRNNRTVQILEMFNTIRSLEAHCIGDCDPYQAPGTNQVVVEIGGNDDLTIGARIIDRDEVTDDDTLIDSSVTIPAREITTGTWHITNRRIDVTVRVEILNE